MKQRKPVSTMFFILMALLFVCLEPSAWGACPPSWNSATVYTGGAQVSVLSLSSPDVVAYTAAYWTQGQNPNTNNGPAGSGKPWISNGICQGDAPPTPTATATATVTPTPGYYAYTVKDAGTYSGTTLAYAVNDSGEIGGISNTTTGGPTTIGDATPTPTPFPRTFVLVDGVLVDPCDNAQPNTVENVNGINAAGVSVGQCNYYEPYSFNGSTLTKLPLPVTGGIGEATAINNTGEIVGIATVSTSGNSQINHAVLWNNGVVTDLGTLGGTWSFASAINSGGTIVGAAYVAGSEQTHAFLYSNGTMTDLGADSYAYGINDSGQIVGSANTPTLPSAHGFLYSGGQLSDLGALVPNGNSAAYAINNSGIIVGESSSNDPSGNTHAFLYSNGTMTDLNTLIDPSLQITLTEARAISPDGNIAANASNGHAYLLTPAPAIPAWAPGVAYSVGQEVTYDGQTYKCIQAHTSETGWEPPNVPALWQLIS